MLLLDVRDLRVTFYKVCCLIWWKVNMYECKNDSKVYKVEKYPSIFLTYKNSNMCTNFKQMEFCNSMLQL
jgi:hypothetical protein